MLLHRSPLAFFILAVLGFELKGFELVKQALYSPHFLPLPPSF
jgi:hypothetical protein